MRPEPRVEAVSAEGCWRDEAMPFDQPSGVVGLAESEQRLAQILDRVEGLHPQEIFLQSSDEAFGTAITLGRADEGGRALGTEEFEFPLESVGHVLLGWTARRHQECQR